MQEGQKLCMSAPQIQGSGFRVTEYPNTLLAWKRLVAAEGCCIFTVADRSRCHELTSLNVFSAFCCTGHDSPSANPTYAFRASHPANDLRQRFYGARISLPTTWAVCTPSKTQRSTKNDLSCQWR